MTPNNPDLWLCENVSNVVSFSLFHTFSGLACPSLTSKNKYEIER